MEVTFEQRSECSEDMSSIGNSEELGSYSL